MKLCKNNDGDAEVSVTLIEEVVVEACEDIFVFVVVDVGISSSAVNDLDLVGDGRVACVESEEILRLWMIGDGDDDFTDELVELCVEKVFGFVIGNRAFDDLSAMDNGKMAYACDKDFVDSVTSSNAFDGVTLRGDDGVTGDSRVNAY